MPDRLASVVLMCRDTAASRRWYEAMGFSWLRGHAGMEWMAAGATEIMLHPAPRPSGGSGLCLHAGVADAAAAFRRARAAGLSPYDHQQPGQELTGPVTRPWGAIEFELDDPDGHRWAFTQAPGA
jgi:uncharacterized glyoxalase superfamily protein PhnB